jgi:hypothetical protein
MNISADFGMNQDFVLAKILLVYSSGHRAFATLHEPKNSPDGGPPYLDEGRPITMEFLKELGRQLGGQPAERDPARQRTRPFCRHAGLVDASPEAFNVLRGCE